MSRTPWGRVLLVCAAGVPAAIALGKIALVAPLMRPDLGLSLPQVGWAVSAITAVAALLGAPAGLWVRRWGPRRSLLTGLAIMAVTASAGAIAWGLGVLLAARVAEGAGYLLVVVAAPDLLVRLTRGTDRAAALALWGSVIPVGLAVGGAAGGTLAQVIGWRGWLGLTGALPLLAAVLVATAVPPDEGAPAPAAGLSPEPAAGLSPEPAAGLSPEPAAGLSPEPVAGLSPRPGPRSRWSGLMGPTLLAGGFCGLCLIGIAVLSLLPTFLVGQRGLGLGAAGVATAVVALASVPGSVAASWLLRRGAGVRLLSAAAAVMPVAALLAFGAVGAVGVGVAAAAVILLANGLAVAGVFAAVPALVRDPHQIALAIGLLTQLGSLGTLLGAPLFGSVVAVADWSAVAPLTGAATLITLGLLLAASAQRPEVAAE